MADLATPSAAAISTINAGADSAAAPAPATKTRPEKPEKPDEKLYKETLATAEKLYEAAQEKFNALRAKIDLAQPKNNNSPSSQRSQALKSELTTIRQQQSGFKSSKGSVQDKIAALDAQLKSRMAEQKTKRAQLPYKSVEEIDREVKRQEQIAESSSATLVDQKKAIAEQSSLRKQRKAFGSLEEAQRGIDEVKAQIAELKKSLDNPEAKALSARYDQIDKELKAIRADQDDAYKNLSALRDQQNQAYADRQEKSKGVREIKDKYHKARIAFREWDQEQYRVRQAREREQREAYQKEKRKRIAEQKLEEASEPAYTDEITTADTLLRYFDPSSVEASKPLRGPSGFAAEASRTIDTSAEIKGTKVARKGDLEEDYFVGTGGKKGKKGRKGAASTPTEGTKFNLTVGIIEGLAKISIEPPMSQAEVPAVIEKVRAKRDNWKAESEAKTKENIARAQKEIDKLEAEAAAEQSGKRKKQDTDAAKTSSPSTPITNGASTATETGNPADVPATETETGIETGKGDTSA